jgi:hypothetical protein
MGNFCPWREITPVIYPIKTAFLSAGIISSNSYIRSLPWFSALLQTNPILIMNDDEKYATILDSFISSVLCDSFCTDSFSCCRPGSSGGIGTGYGLDGPGT